jgi:dCTP deaminase
MDLKNYVGTINDEMIRSECAKKNLISKNFKPENITEACYELSASNIYYDLSNNYQRIDIKAENYPYILIKPKQSIVVITKEELNIPANVIGRVLTKGKLFSIGLMPVNTYADPGFKGNLGIILHNNSLKYLKISEDELIAKIEFLFFNNQ